jgi:hypothetical protein
VDQLTSGCLRDALRKHALRPLTQLVLDSLALLQGLETVADYLLVVHEDVCAPPVRSDEALALRVVEPLNRSHCHTSLQLTAHTRAPPLRVRPPYASPTARGRPLERARTGAPTIPVLSSESRLFPHSKSLERLPLPWECSVATWSKRVNTSDSPPSRAFPCAARLERRLYANVAAHHG